LKLSVDLVIKSISSTLYCGCPSILSEDLQFSMNTALLGNTVSATYAIDPVEDERWTALVNRHPRASVFHTPGWLEALRRTYGYEIVALTTSKPDEELQDGVVFCRIRSWLTGNRLVSLPFADHCDPLVEDPGTFELLLTSLKQEVNDGSWQSLELRPRAASLYRTMAETMHESSEYCFHSLDLRTDSSFIYQHMHKSCVQRKIKRAEREKFTYEQGRSEALLKKFYKLVLLTRRRHQLPPQSLDWFRNVLQHLEEQACIHLLSKDGQPLASVLTLSFRKTMVYKYGCSDGRYHSLGTMPFLFWNVIQEAKGKGFDEFDLGRSDLDQAGLMEFKDHLGADRSQLKYFSTTPLKGHKRVGQAGTLRKAFSHMPDAVQRAAGSILYRHFG
jgi:Acetyltransferase (GNAT) domain